MTTIQIAANPFALMMNPEAVFAAIERSERLARLQSRLCQPLDKPMTLRPDGSPMPDPDAKSSGDGAGLTA